METTSICSCDFANKTFTLIYGLLFCYSAIDVCPKKYVNFFKQDCGERLLFAKEILFNKLLKQNTRYNYKSYETR